MRRSHTHAAAPTEQAGTGLLTGTDRVGGLQLDAHRRGLQVPGHGGTEVFENETTR